MDASKETDVKGKKTYDAVKTEESPAKAPPEPSATLSEVISSLTAPSTHSSSSSPWPTPTTSSSWCVEALAASSRVRSLHYLFSSQLPARNVYPHVQCSVRTNLRCSEQEPQRPERFQTGHRCHLCRLHSAWSHQPSHWISSSTLQHHHHPMLTPLCRCTAGPSLANVRHISSGPAMSRLF